MATFVKFICCYFVNKPHDWKNDYLDIRLFFTKILLKFSFAMMSPKQLIKHKNDVKQNLAKDKIKKTHKKIKHRKAIDKIKLHKKSI